MQTLLFKNEIECQQLSLCQAHTLQQDILTVVLGLGIA